jgi:hypothetical protein
MASYVMGAAGLDLASNKRLKCLYSGSYGGRTGVLATDPAAAHRPLVLRRSVHAVHACAPNRSSATWALYEKLSVSAGREHGRVVVGIVHVCPTQRFGEPSQQLELTLPILGKRIGCLKSSFRSLLP